MKKIYKITNETPVWFRRIKKGVSILSNTIVLILLGVGYADNSLAILICRLGISGIMDVLEAFIAEEV